MLEINATGLSESAQLAFPWCTVRVLALCWARLSSQRITRNHDGHDQKFHLTEPRLSVLAFHCGSATIANMSRPPFPGALSPIR